MSTARNYVSTYPVKIRGNSCNINFAVEGLPTLFLITTYQASKTFNLQLRFISSFTGQGCSSGGFIYLHFYIVAWKYFCVRKVLKPRLYFYPVRLQWKAYLKITALLLDKYQLVNQYYLLVVTVPL